MAISVCNGGTVLAGATSITFTNGSGSTVYINNCTVPGFPVIAPPGIPIPTGGHTVQLSSAIPSQGGPWTYSASGGCNANPSIRPGVGMGHGHGHEHPEEKAS